ncbi:MAG: hypothetical protein J1F64_02640 [Oscillospiraceae bacterium]|nr:hypothetical protein [Oscillospiraceae bacterium]
MDEMMKKINKYPNGTYLKIEFSDGLLVLYGTIDTMYETNNGLEEDEDGYKEFYACLISIEKIITNLSDNILQEGDLIEISIEDQPTLIETRDGTVIWKAHP